MPANPFVIDFLGNVNLFHGRVEGSKAFFGPLVMDYPEGLERQETPRRGCWCVRTTWRSAAETGRPVHVSPPRSCGFSAAGPQVKIELSGPSGASTVNVEMPHEHFRRMRDRRRRSRLRPPPRRPRVHGRLQHLSGLEGAGTANGTKFEHLCNRKC